MLPTTKRSANLVMQGGYPSPCVRCTLLPSGHFPLRGVRKARKLLTCALQYKRHTRRKGGNSIIAVVRAHFVRYNINGQFYQMREERLRHARNCRRFQYFPLGTTFESTTASKLCSPQQHSTRKASPALYSQVGSKRSSTSAKRFASVRSRTEPENVGSKITPNPLSHYICPDSGSRYHPDTPYARQTCIRLHVQSPYVHKNRYIRASLWGFFSAPSRFQFTHRHYGSTLP